jgi:predicted permease
VAALTLALGIGANAGVFSLVNGLLFRPPAAIEEPHRLVQLARSYETAPRWDNFSWPAMETIAAEARALSGVAGYASATFVLGRGAEVEQLPGQYVTGTYFDLLGVTPHLGRLLGPDDDRRPGAHPLMVISHGLWTRRFGADPSVVGRSVPIGARPYEIVGVAPAGFAGVESVATPPELWIPAMQTPGFRGELPFEQWGSSWLQLVGRLADGVDVEAARASLDVVSARLREASPVNEDILVLLAEGVGLDPAGRSQAEGISLILLLIVGVVLLLTCTNVANLLLARASTRRAEIGMRMALGAARVRLARQLLTESLLLALLGTALAVPLVVLAGRFLPAVFPYTLAVSVAADGRVFALLALLGTVAGLLFGAFPAWSATRSGVSAALREGASTEGRSRLRARDALVVLQLALSLGLVSGAALLGRSVLNARSARPGFEPAGLVAAFLDLEPTGRYDREAGRALFERILDEAGRIPGVQAATLANQAPIAGGHSRSTVRPAGRDDLDFEAEYMVVGPGYFEALEIPLLAGRTLRGFDDEPEHVVVVNEALARLFWPDEAAVGKELAGDPALRVVGVVGDVQMRSLRSAARPAVYHTLAHEYSARMVLHLRGRAGSEPDGRGVRGAVAAVDPELPVAAVLGLQEAMAASMAETRTIGHLVTAFAVLALLLAAVGLYGLVAYGAAQRVRELGIRIALGAAPGSLVGLVLVRGVWIALLGVGVGLTVSFALGRALEGLLFGVGSGDLPTLAAASALLLLTATVAAWLPARRAARADAWVSLRD